MRTTRRQTRKELNPAVSSPRRADEFRLTELQGLLYRLITAPAGVEEAVDRECALQDHGLDGVIAGNKRLTAANRLRTYANAYFYRLLDIFKEEFSCLYTVVGDVNFHNLITGYLLEHPPSTPSVLCAGHELARYLETRPAAIPFSQFPFLANLARLERACIEVFHGPDAEPLEAASLCDLKPDTWPMLRIRLHPATQIFNIEWRVDTLVSAMKEGQQWEPPQRSGATMLVWRKQFVVHYRSLQPGERAALKTAEDSANFAEVCAALASEMKATAGPTELAITINQMLNGWLREGILIRTD
jgi:hypothetical protein